MNKPTTFVKSVETWYPKGNRNETGRVVIAVRARKGSTAQRPGTFHGSTNFKTR